MIITKRIISNMHIQQIRWNSFCLCSRHSILNVSMAQQFEKEIHFTGAQPLVSCSTTGGVNWLCPSHLTPPAELLFFRSGNTSGWTAFKNVVALHSCGRYPVMSEQGPTTMKPSRSEKHFFFKFSRHFRPPLSITTLQSDNTIFDKTFTVNQRGHFTPFRGLQQVVSLKMHITYITAISTECIAKQWTVKQKGVRPHICKSGVGYRSTLRC